LALPFLQRRAEEEGIQLEIRFADSSRLPIRIGRDEKGIDRLVVHTRHPSLFIQLLMAQTPEQFFLTADQDGHTHVSSYDVFKRLMTPRPEARIAGEDDWIVKKLRVWIDTVRRDHLFFLLSFCDRPIPPSIVIGSRKHVVQPLGIRHNLSLLIILGSLLFADKLEEKVFRMLNARFYPGQEPWTVWKRTVETLWREQGHGVRLYPVSESDRVFGSVIDERV
jgi:hypothetical protein